MHEKLFITIKVYIFATANEIKIVIAKACFFIFFLEIYLYNVYFNNVHKTLYI